MGHPKSVEHSTSVCAAKPVLQLCEPLSFLAGDSVRRRSDGHSTFVGATNPAHRQSDKHFEFPRVTGLQCDDFASRTAKSAAHSADSATPAPVIENMAYAPAVTHTAPAPMIEIVAPTPAVTSATPAPVIEHVATPAVSSAIGPSVSDVFEAGRSPASAVPDQPGDPARRDFADTV